MIEATLKWSKQNLPKIILESNELHGKKLNIGYTRSCNHPEKQLNCMTAKQWIKSQIGVWQFHYGGRDIRDKTIHPATFPIALADQVIQLFSHKGELILDPFVGSGTVLVAAQDLDRNAVGFDLQDKYVKLCGSRIANDPGLTPGSQPGRGESSSHTTGQTEAGSSQGSSNGLQSGQRNGSNKIPIDITPQETKDSQLNFRIRSSVKLEFSRKCRLMGYSLTQVIEQFMINFNEAPDEELLKGRKNLEFDIHAIPVDPRNIIVNVPLINIEKPEDPNTLAVKTTIQENDLKLILEKEGRLKKTLGGYERCPESQMAIYMREKAPELKALCLKYAKRHNDLAAIQSTLKFCDGVMERLKKQ